jgi:hypothetical protein
VASAQPESPLALIPLASKSHAYFKVCTELRTVFFIFRSGLSVTGLARDYCTAVPVPKLLFAGFLLQYNVTRHSFNPGLTIRHVYKSGHQKRFLSFLATEFICVPTVTVRAVRHITKKNLTWLFILKKVTKEAGTTCTMRAENRHLHDLLLLNDHFCVLFNSLNPSGHYTYHLR